MDMRTGALREHYTIPVAKVRSSLKHVPAIRRKPFITLFILNLSTKTNKLMALHSLFYRKCYLHVHTGTHGQHLSQHFAHFASVHRSMFVTPVIQPARVELRIHLKS